MNESIKMGDAFRLQCPFCLKHTRTRTASPSGFQEGYMMMFAHYVESHWEQLEASHEMRLLLPMNENTLAAWQR